MEATQGSESPLPEHSNMYAAPVAFPFNEAGAQISTRDLFAQLAPREEAWTLVEAYYRYCAWQ